MDEPERVSDSNKEGSLSRDGDGSLEHGCQGSLWKFGDLCVLWRGRSGELGSVLQAV